ncbi:MAG: carboxypeptidase regulatory-like domain-containing protein [Actinomycetota bacterium]
MVPTGVGTFQGFVIDSVHNGPLVGAIVMISGVPQIAQTGPDGSYRIDSVPPGSYKLSLSHPLLDTLGMSVTTPSMVLRPNETATVDLALPSGNRIVSMLCPAPMLAARGPGAFIGQVNDPDTNTPAVGAKVQLVYDEPNPLGLKTRQTVRESAVDSGGSYKICGLPVPFTGKLQVFRSGVSSGQVEVRIEEGAVGLRSLTVAGIRQVAAVADTAGHVKHLYIGSARLTGKVTNKAGQPVAGARVGLEGAAAATVTGPRGDFSLDSLPAGTQSVEVRKLGYSPTDKSVELATGTPASVTVVMNDYQLAPVRIEALRESALVDLGYTDRKRRGSGFFMDGDKIRQEAAHFSEVVRQAPMLKLIPTSNGRYVIQSARDPNMGCVRFVVDGSPFKEMSPGDIDDYIQPNEVRAIEIYNPSSAPAQFQDPAATKCATVVVWTVRGINRASRKK